MTTYRVEAVRIKDFPGYAAGTVGAVYCAKCECASEAAAFAYVADALGYDSAAELLADLAAADRPTTLRAVAI